MTKLLRTSLVLFISAQVFLSCTAPDKTQSAPLTTGKWRGVLSIQAQELPFNFEVVKKDAKYSIYLINATERLLLSGITFNADSVKIPMHIFDADIVAKVYADSLVGYWTKNYAENYKIPFKAKLGMAYRFKPTNTNKPHDFTGRYDATFIYDQTDTVKAIGIFEQTGKKVTGTFLTKTGDYRFLEGIADGNNILLSTFDGGHAFLFKAVLNSDSTLSGEFWSGKTWHEPWTAFENNHVILPDANEITYLKKGFNTVNFEFPDLDGKLVSPNDAKYKGKVLILQIFGTWCPNCMDETIFLTKWYDENRERGVEILGLSYEAKDDFEYAKSRILHMKNKLEINFDYVIAGTSSKKEASKTLPMLNAISAFPTLLFIDKKGEVRKIHTGFSGPGTGDLYEHFIKDFNATVDELVKN